MSANKCGDRAKACSLHSRFVYPHAIGTPRKSISVAIPVIRTLLTGMAGFFTHRPTPTSYRKISGWSVVEMANGIGIVV